MHAVTIRRRRGCRVFLFIAIMLVLLWFWKFSPVLPSNHWPSYYTANLTQTPPTRTPAAQTPPARTPTAQTPPAQRQPRCFQPGPGSERDLLVAVRGTHTLLVSAYLDLRNPRREVRVISVALRSEQVAYQCLLCCQGQPHITAGLKDVHSDHFGFDYGTADIFCFLPDGCLDPSHVAVSVVAAPMEKSSQEEEEEEEEEPRFLEVQNRNPISKDFPHNFTVCFSTMFDFSNVLQLVQNMEMLRFLGVSKVILYKTSCNADTQKLLDYYKRTGFMEVIAWPVSGRLNVSHGWKPKVSPGQLQYYGQIPALHDCVYRCMYQSSYLGLHDLDELILPQSVDSWTELLPLLERDLGMDLCYIFENFVFPTTVFRSTPVIASPQAFPLTRWQEVEGVNILDHLYYEPRNSLHFSNYKILVNPRAVVAPTVHGLLESLRGCAHVPTHVARLHHTRAPASPGLELGDLLFDSRLLAYRERLILAVDAVLEQTGLLSPPQPSRPPLGD